MMPQRQSPTAANKATDPAKPATSGGLKDQQAGVCGDRRAISGLFHVPLHLHTERPLRMPKQSHLFSLLRTNQAFTRLKNSELLPGASMCIVNTHARATPWRTIVGNSLCHVMRARSLSQTCSSRLFCI